MAQAQTVEEGKGWRQMGQASLGAGRAAVAEVEEEEDDDDASDSARGAAVARDRA